MKHLNTYITEYIIKKKLDKPIDSEYQYHPNSKEELTKNIQELISNKIYDFNCIDTSEITDMSNLFGDIVNNINKINFDVSKWDVSNVTNMAFMFVGCESFEGKGLENWDVSNVEISSFMFVKCENLNCDLSKWDVRNIIRMSSMFSYCKKFEGKGLENWDISNVVSLRNMFKGCENFDCDFSKWNVSNVVDTTNMFYGCTSLKNKPSWYKE